MKKTNLKEAVIAVTYRCNSKCRMCSIWKIKDHGYEISAGDLAKLPGGLKDINLTGGEPFLRPDLPELVSSLAKSHPGASIIISTNGFATDLIVEKTRQMLEVKPDLGIAVSLDGYGQAHSEVRGIPGGFEKSVKTIRELQKAGVKNLKIGFTLGDYNIDELKKVYRLSKQLGVEFTLALVHSSDNYFGQENKINDLEKIIKELDWISGEEIRGWRLKNWGRSYFAYGLREFARTGQRILPDYSGELNVFIDPKGDIYPCDISSEKIGNLREIGSWREVKAPESACDRSWMMCTARQPIKKHKYRVLRWVLSNKIKSLA